MFNKNESRIFNCNKIKRREVNSQNVTYIKSNTGSELNTTKTLIIYNVKNKKIDEDLYKDINTKDVKVDERSFIYIKQRTRRPLENHIFLNKVPKERIDLTKTDTSYLLSRNNVFEEFHRRFLLGRTYIDKNRGYNNLVLGTTEDYCNTKTKNSGNKKTSDINYSYQDDKSVSKEKEKYFFSDIKPFLKLYVTNVTNKKTATLKSDANYSDEMLSLQAVIKLPDKVINPLAKPSFKSDSHYEKKLEKGQNQNTVDGIKAERLNTKAFVDQILKRQNNTQIDRFGFYFCLDCIKKLKKQNLKNPLLIKKNCICRHEQAKKETILLIRE